MMTRINKKFVSGFLAGLLALCSLPVLSASATGSGQETLNNLLAADMDTHFDGGTSPFTAPTNTGGSQKIIQNNGNNALEFRDASTNADGTNTNAASTFAYKKTSGTVLGRINQIYSMPVGSAPVEFVLEYKLKRTAASNKPVPNNIYAQIQFGNFDNNLIPRFPTGAPSPSIAGTSAYLNSQPDVMLTINDRDIAGYRFKVIPNGGARKITSFELDFSVRVDTGGTDEAYAVDDLALYEVVPNAVQDTQAPSAPAGLTVSGQTDTSVSLSWTASTDNVGVTGYDIYRDGILTDSVSGLNDTMVGLSPRSSYRFAVKAKDGAGNASGFSNEVSATTNPSAGGLPQPFGDRDIGSVGVAGSAVYSPDTGAYKVKGSGADIWGTDDAFHYVYQPLTGDGQVVARVTSVENVASWTKAGIMIRGSMSSQSPYAMMALTPANGLNFQDRLQAGGSSTLTAGTTSATAPYWVKLVRQGSLISAYYSSDGALWKMAKQEQIILPDTVYFGLAVTSHYNGKTAAAEFDHVNVGKITPTQLNPSSPYPGTVESRRQWLWDRTKSMLEESGPLNIVQYTAQLIDGQDTATNLQKLDTLFQTYDAEQYKTVGKMYAYLLAGDKFSSTMMSHVRNYFAQYAYAKLAQTENLRMSNYTVGYLVGQYFPDIVDLNGNSGASLKSMNRANIEEMVQAAVHGGWAEYESPEYTFMTYFCLNALYQYSDEPDFRQKVKMAMDVMWFEWANDWINGTFVSSTSRSKGDSVSASDPSWRGADHTALAWMYFGQHRAQDGIGDSDSYVPSAYRPFLEYLGMVIAPGMTYTPSEMAIRIGQSTDKSYTSRKTNLQNSSGRNLKVYRQAYVKPVWGIASEVTYNRVDNWIEDIPVTLRWLSASPDSLFRVNADQGDSPIGNYDQPENHRLMQDGKAVIGVYKNLTADATENYLNAMFPDTGSIKTKEEQSGWVFVDTGPMYFAFKMIKPYSWYYQTPFDPANKVKATTQLHPTKTLSYNYNILRSQADRNGWILDTADASEYADFASFKNAVLTTTAVDSSHVNDANPRLIYKNLSGHTMDITFDLASGSYNGTHLINGKAIDYNSFKLFDTPWLQQAPNSNIFTATQGGQQLVYNFADWTITGNGEAVAVPNSSFENGTAARPDSWTFTSLGGASAGTWDASAANTGSHSAAIANVNAADEGSWNTADSNKIAVQPGYDYALQAWVKSAGIQVPEGEGVRVGMTFYKSDGTALAGGTVIPTGLSGTNDWTLMSATATAPADAALMSISLDLKGAGKVWFDEVELIAKQHIALTGVTLNASALTLAAGKTTGLTPAFQPPDATNKTVTWSSDQPSVATVDANGQVTAVAPGTAVIAVTTEDGSYTAKCTVTVTLEPLFADSFAGGIGSWDLFGSTVWQVQGGGTDAAQLAGTTTSSSPQRAVVKQSLLPYSSQDYSLGFTAKGDRFRTMFRYSSSTGYYFLEFKNANTVELWKYPQSSTPAQVGTTVDISTVIPGYNLADWHQYRVDVKGTGYKLFIDGTLVAAFNDSSLTAGGIGFALKSVGPAVSMNVEQVTVMPIIAPSDDMPPVTAADMAPALPDGQNGWYVHPVTVTLNAYDDPSGVAKTEYSLDGGATWQPYTSAFTFDKEGQYTVSYHSTDNAGNVEAAKTISFNLDTTAPVTVAIPSLPDGANGWYMHQATVSLVATDILAGVAKTEYSLDGGTTWQRYTSALTFDKEGQYTVSCRSTDNAGNVETVKTVNVNVDSTAPVTTAVASPAVPDGQDGWYVHPVTITLSASDNLSGVAKTEISVDGGSTWQTYTGPVTLNQDNKYTVSYRSTDNAGNVEAAKTIGFNLDTIAPTITVSGAAYGSYSDSVDITPILTLIDNLSGVDSSKTTVTLDTYSIQQGATIPLYTLPLGLHTLIVTASDMAGNTNSQSVLFQTTTTIQSMQALVTRFTNMGWIDNSGIANSLQSKLAGNALADCLGEVKAQSGKHISVQAAGYLLRNAQYLLSKL